MGAQARCVVWQMGPTGHSVSDNRQMNGQQGFYVVTPRSWKVTGAGFWCNAVGARDFTDRTRLPVVPTPDGMVVLSGRIAEAPGKVYQLGEDGLGPIRQNLVFLLSRKSTRRLF